MSSPAVIILSAPSGAGKTSLARRLVERHASVAVAVSHTTRAKRRGEREGVDYFFVGEEEFAAMVTAGDFLEHAEVFGNRYGTSKEAIARLAAAGRHAILEIDWQGARAVRERFAEARSIFIMPPSVDALRLRLLQRSQDDAATIAKRMQAAEDEMSHKNEYDYVIVNDDFDSAFAKLEGILREIEGG